MQPVIDFGAFSDTTSSLPCDPGESHPNLHAKQTIAPVLAKPVDTARTLFAFCLDGRVSSSGGGVLEVHTGTRGSTSRHDASS